MKQPRAPLSQIIATTTLKDGDISRKFAEEVAAYLLEEGRTDELESVLRDVQADWAQAGFVEVLAYSARPLTADVKKDITAQVKTVFSGAKTVRITELIDATVIGGVRLKLPNRQLDLSVEAKLDRFKQLTEAGKDV